MCCCAGRCGHARWVRIGHDHCARLFLRWRHLLNQGKCRVRTRILCDSDIFGHIFEINFIKRKKIIFSPSCGRRLCTITCLPVLTPRRHYRFSLCINLHRPLLTPVNMYTISRIKVSTRRCVNELEKEKGKLLQVLRRLSTCHSQIVVGFASYL